MKLTGLPFTSEQFTKTMWFRTVSQGMRRLTKATAITTAADNGAINAWWGNDGKWHAERCCYRVTEDEWSGATKKELRAWIVDALELIQ